ncbi:MAG TPA: beta-ketoacyl synthase N-terminal-like domain-containing protein [Puia sp.]|nr:beta-ketoacyl synthase N-terminal-like domain-containing protein [Puia sp.]
MNIYIRAAAAISPQRTFGPSSSLTEPVGYTGIRLKSIEPDYKNYIDARLLRRMSRIVRMGVTAARECLRQVEEKEPGAIITGTAYGCLEDTEIFLTEMIGQKEEIVAPGAFIQSTHNTIGAQIALILQCTAYNNTFVHRGFSFESALLDAMMLLQEGEAASALVGGVDEITDITHRLLTRFGLYRRFPVSNLDLFLSGSKGTIAGEGAAFFLLAASPSENDYARLEGVTTFYKPDTIEEIEQHILSFLKVHQIGLEDIDLIITGRNGDESGDEIYNSLGRSVFSQKKSINYKQLCGEYPTSTAFAFWLAANLITPRTMPGIRASVQLPEDKIERVLIYNHYLRTQHSLLLLSACR